MCDCGSTCLGNCSIDLTGIGQVGATGAQGEYGGYSSVWNFSTTTTSGTTAGQLRFNSGTYASVTTMYINKTNQDSTDLSNFLATLSNGTYYGKIRIFKESDSSKFWEGTITNVSAGASEYTLTVSYILANSTFAASDSVVLSFTPHGIGAKPLLFTASGNLVTATTGSWSTINATTFTVPAGLLTTNGDAIEIIVQGYIGTVATAFNYNAVRLLINGTNMSTTAPGYSVGLSEMLHHSDTGFGTEFQIRTILERVSSTAVQDSTVCIANGLTCHTYYSDQYTMNNLDSSTNNISVQAYQQDTANSVIIYSIKAIKILQ